MKKLLVILFVVALPAISFAEEVVVPRTGPTPKSFQVNDIFHFLAHTCDSNGGLPCGPDNLVTNNFSAVIDMFIPVTQPYTRYYIIKDIEGNVRFLDGATSIVPAGFFSFFFNNIAVPTSSSVATRGLYQFVSLVVGADGRIALSDYYRFRVLP